MRKILDIGWEVDCMYEIIVVFRDGEELKISKVSDVIAKDNYYEVHKNGYGMFFNFDAVKYIARTFDLKEGD